MSTLHPVQFTATPFAQMPFSQMDEWQRTATSWTVTLQYPDLRAGANGRPRKPQTARFDFWQGPAFTLPPTLADVLPCLFSDADAADSTFEDFCDDFGYDTDSRRAEHTYRLCQQTAIRLRHLFGSDFEAVRQYAADLEDAAS